MNSGVVFTVLFTLAAAARDVFFGGVFQHYRYFDVVLVTFGLASALFIALVTLRAPEQWARLLRAWKDCVVANVGTAAAWMSFFFALKMVEPAIVNTIHTGMGAVTLVAAGAVGLRISAKVQVRTRERWIQLGVFMTLLALAGVVLAGLSGVAGRTLEQNLVGLALAFGSGIFISLTSDVTKRMHERGVSVEGVLAMRFLLGVAICAVAVALDVGAERPLADVRALVTVGGAGLLLIVAPLYLFQLGLARTSAISVWVIQALGPCLVFAAQLLDGRISPSPWTLACVAVYSALVMTGALVRNYETDGVAPAKAGVQERAKTGFPLARE
jgi:drug/metabolite transporter (DMT)-like permease